MGNGYYCGVMHAEEIQPGQMIETTFGPGRVMFVKWYANDPQLKGYFVLEDEAGEPRLVTMFQGETVPAAGKWLEASPVDG